MNTTNEIQSSQPFYCVLTNKQQFVFIKFNTDKLTGSTVYILSILLSNHRVTQVMFLIYTTSRQFPSGVGRDDWFPLTKVLNIASSTMNNRCVHARRFLVLFTRNFFRISSTYLVNGAISTFSKILIRTSLKLSGKERGRPLRYNGTTQATDKIRNLYSNLCCYRSDLERLAHNRNKS